MCANTLPSSFIQYRQTTLENSVSHDLYQGRRSMTDSQCSVHGFFKSIVSSCFYIHGSILFHSLLLHYLPIALLLWYLCYLSIVLLLWCLCYVPLYSIISMVSMLFTSLQFYFYCIYVMYLSTSSTSMVSMLCTSIVLLLWSLCYLTIV